jgi:hypothetical protein
VGVLEKVDPKQSPVNFFNIDFEKYPYAKNAKFLDATLNAGDCLYIPAFYYI